MGDSEGLDWRDFVSEEGAEFLENDRPVFERVAEERSEEAADLVENPPADADHHVTGTFEQPVRVHLEYREDSDDIGVAREESILPDTPGSGVGILPETLSCACGARPMTWLEALEHLRKAKDLE